jgi:bifunctional UDP-N-acetylglucosamine pyrophosphorylase/glucosamine-1-phosphate N-acetyltransferase
MKLTTVILAAGEGKRMRSDLPKVLHTLCGKPLLHHVLEAAGRLGRHRTIVVVGHHGEAVAAALPAHAVSVDQGEPRGTGHALLCVKKAYPSLKGTVLVLSGDVPLLSHETLQEFLLFHQGERADFSLATAVLEDPKSYGRIVRDPSGNVTAIREATDAPPEILAIREVNAGIYALRWEKIAPLLDRLRSNNRQKEYYLTDLAAAALRRGMKVRPFPMRDAAEMLGVNSRGDLADLHRLLYQKKAQDLMARGVTLLDPSHTYIAPDVEVGRDTLIYPGVVVESSRIGARCRIYPGNVIQDTVLGDDCILNPHNIIEGSRIGNDCRVGPSAHMRPGTVLGDGVRVGNFVETKKAVLGKGTKAAHLTYLGDAVIGRGVNIGCGTITCNYDGRRKHQTVIEDGAFIGSDCQLIAPVTVGKNAYTASGTTVTEDVPEDALAIGRARQRNVLGWAKKKRGK